MLTSKEFIESGILEQYVLGAATSEERRQVELMAAADRAVQQELAAIEKALETFATNQSIPVNPILKPFLLATIDYTERLRNGEEVTNPPMLSESTTVADFAPWLNRSDMIMPDTKDVVAKIIGYTPKAITAIVWLQDYAPQEVHDDEYENFFIVEGTCEIIVEDEINQLGPGDYFAIPLHKTHLVKVTSAIPCKVILQRVAA